MDRDLNTNRRIYFDDLIPSIRSSFAEEIHGEFLRKLKDTPIGFIHSFDRDILTPNEQRELQEACNDIRTTTLTLGVDEGVALAERHLNDLIYKIVYRSTGVPRDILDISRWCADNSKLEQEVFFEEPLKQSHELNKFLKTFKINTEEVSK